jgi:glycine cleavage system H lipoate-binding protein/ABC-type phosphate transport system substrate-binding protein
MNMKKRVCLLAAILFLGCHFTEGKVAPVGNNPTREGTVNLYTTPALYGLSRIWVNEYTRSHPDMKINVTQEMNSVAVLNSRGGIGIIDDESSISRDHTGWSIVVGRDIIVPFMNRLNPAREKIIKNGITPESLTRLTENGQNLFVKCYATNDSAVIRSVKRFMKTGDLKSKGMVTASDEEVLANVSKYPNLMGFCRLTRIATSDVPGLPENIELVPIDKNSNGKIDYMEEIYDNLQTFERGVWIGKYPKALLGRIYAVAMQKPASEPELAFLSWVLTDGQEYLKNFGYSDLVLNERQSQLTKIEPVQLILQASENPKSPIRWILIVLLTLGVIAVLWKVIAGLGLTRNESVANTQAGEIPVFDESATVIPGGLYFDKTHTWAFMKKDGTVKVGIDDFLQHVTGPITRIELKKTGDKIRKGEHLFTLVQKGKQLDIYSPVSGTIREKNKSLSDDPSLINTSPYKEGWIYSIEPKNWLVEIQFLSMAEKYKTELKKEFLRLKDFFVSALKANEPEYALVLQDGGALKDNILEELGPEIWDDFQTKFINSALH